MSRDARFRLICALTLAGCAILTYTNWMHLIHEGSFYQKQSFFTPFGMGIGLTFLLNPPPDPSMFTLDANGRKRYPIPPVLSRILLVAGFFAGILNTYVMSHYTPH